MEINQTPLNPAYPRITYHVCVKMVGKLVGFASVGLQEVDDMAAETAARFWRASVEGQIRDPLSFLWGVARHVVQESIRKKQADRHRPFSLEMPSPVDAPDEDSSVLTGEFIDRLREKASQRERDVLAYMAEANKHRNSEFAAELGMTSRAFTVAKNRLKRRARFLHAQMVAETLPSRGRFPTLEQQSRLLALARTRRERADFRLQLLLRAQDAVLRMSPEFFYRGLRHFSWAYDPLSQPLPPILFDNKSSVPDCKTPAPLFYKPIAPIPPSQDPSGDPLFVATFQFAICRQGALSDPDDEEEFLQWCKNIRDCALQYLLIEDDGIVFSLLLALQEIIRFRLWDLFPQARDATIDILAQTIPFFRNGQSRRDMSDLILGLSRAKWSMMPSVFCIGRQAFPPTPCYGDADRL